MGSGLVASGYSGWVDRRGDIWHQCTTIRLPEKVGIKTAFGRRVYYLYKCNGKKLHDLVLFGDL